MNLRTYINTIVCAVAICLFGCSQRNQPSPPTNPPDTIGVADLKVSSIEIVPEIPKATEQFSLNVDVTNEGQAPSEEYDLRIYYQPAGDPNTFFFCVEKVHKRAVQLGETVRVYSSTDRTTNEPGSYVLHVILHMANGKTITKEWPFSSVPRS